MTNTDVLIVGGGITGCALAYYLRKSGTNTVLVDRHDLNTRASGANAGSVHAQMITADIFDGDHAAEVKKAGPLVAALGAAASVWQTLEAELGEDLEFSHTGGLVIADRPELMEPLERKAAFENRMGLDVELLDRTALLRIAPYLSEKCVGATFCGVEGRANSLIAATAFARAARRNGASIRIGSEVVGLSRMGGKYRAETTTGTIEADIVVNCAGAEAASVSRFLGIKTPVIGELYQVTVTEPAPPLVRHLVYYAGGYLTLKQTSRGALIIGGGWPAALGLHGRPRVAFESLRDNLAVCRRVVPHSAGIRVVRSWPGIVNQTADSWPIMGEVHGAPGYFIATFPYMGFTGGPLTAKTVASMILRRKPSFDASAFSPNRFRTM